MSNSDTPSEVSPAIRARLQKCFEYGNQQMQNGNHDYATEMFIQCVVGDPSNLIYMNSFIVNLRRKYGNQKKGSLFGFLKKPGKGAAGATYNQKDSLQKVLEDGCKKLCSNPWDTAAFVMMGKACLDHELVEPGLAYLKHAVESSPEDIEVNRLAATELGDRYIYDQALICWQRVLKLNPQDTEAGKKISDLMMEQTIQKVQSNKGGAKEPVEADDPKAGLTVEDQCEKRIKKDPKDREAYLELADYSFQRGNYRKVEDAYRRALREFPDDPAFSLGLLEIQRTRAREDYNRAKTIYDKNPSDDMKEKLQKQKADLDQKSLALIQAKLVQSPDSSQLHFELGQFLMKHGQSKEAITEFQAAKADVSMKGDCLLALAQCFQHIKQYRLAMSHYEQAIASLAEGESLKQALYLATRLACGLNKFEEADDFANRLAAIDFSYKDIGDLLDKIAEKRHN